MYLIRMKSVKVLCCLLLWLFFFNLHSNVCADEVSVNETTPDADVDFSANNDVTIDEENIEYDEIVETDGERDEDEIITPENEEVDDDEYGRLPPSSPYAKIRMMIIDPINVTQIVHGLRCRFLINFENMARSTNFTIGKYHDTIKPGEEMNFEYDFAVSEMFATRPVGLVMIARYTDDRSRSFANVLFNQTIIINDPVSAFDAELFFLYVFFFALLVLAGLGIQQGISYLMKKSRKGAKRKIQTNEQNYIDGIATKGEVNFDWIPKDSLKIFAKRNAMQLAAQKGVMKKRKKSKNNARPEMESGGEDVANQDGITADGYEKTSKSD